MLHTEETVRAGIRVKDGVRAGMRCSPVHAIMQDTFVFCAEVRFFLLLHGMAPADIVSISLPAPRYKILFADIIIGEKNLVSYRKLFGKRRKQTQVAAFKFRKGFLVHGSQYAAAGLDSSVPAFACERKIDQKIFHMRIVEIMDF